MVCTILLCKLWLESSPSCSCSRRHFRILLSQFQGPLSRPDPWTFTQQLLFNLSDESELCSFAEGGRKTPGRSVHGERANFRVLVLLCIDASDSESRRIFHRFSRSTRLSLLRTAPNPKFQQKLANFFP